MSPQLPDSQLEQIKSRKVNTFLPSLYEWQQPCFWSNRAVTVVLGEVTKKEMW